MTKLSEFYIGATPDGIAFNLTESLQGDCIVDATGKILATIQKNEITGINCRNYIGQTIKLNTKSNRAYRDPRLIFQRCKIPCSVFKVTGEPYDEIQGIGWFDEVTIIEEILEKEFDKLFGFKYSEASNPINPLEITPPEIGQIHKDLLYDWAFVRAIGGFKEYVTTGHSIWNAVKNSIKYEKTHRTGIGHWTSEWILAADPVYDVFESLEEKLHIAIGNQFESLPIEATTRITSSLTDACGAYVGSLFPKINKWVCCEKINKPYPFDSAAILWKMGLIPIYDNKYWHLIGAGKVLLSEQIWFPRWL